MITTHATRRITIPAAGTTLYGDLSWPIAPGRVHGLAVIAHASSGSRLNPRNQALAAALNRTGFATLLTDLLGTDEDQWEASAVKARHDVDLLSSRLRAVVDRVALLDVEVAALPVAVVGTGTTGAAAVHTAALLAEAPPVTEGVRPPRAGHIDAVVCRSGRPDLWEDGPTVPVLSLVAEQDHESRERHRDTPAGEVRVVEGAADLVEDRTAVEAVAVLAGEWLAGRLDPEHAGPRLPGAGSG
jgi:putative phosphoribosyl transferase